MKSKNLQNFSTQHHEVKAFLESGCSLEGKLHFTGVVRLNGKFKGEITTDNTLIVGETGDIDGKISVGALLLGGKLYGDVTATQYVELQNCSVFEGKLSAPCLISHEGAKIKGSIEVSGKL